MKKTATKRRVVTDVEEAWRLRQAGLLWFKCRKATPLFDRELHDECFSYPSNAGVYFMLCEEDEDEWLAK